MEIEDKLIQEISTAMKLKFSKEETEEFTDEINKTLLMLETIDEVDTEGVEGTFYGAVNRKARFRKDEAVQSDKEVEALLDRTPTSVDQLIQVPAILDEGEGGA